MMTQIPEGEHTAELVFFAHLRKPGFLMGFEGYYATSAYGIVRFNVIRPIALIDTPKAYFPPMDTTSPDMCSIDSASEIV